MVRLYALDIRNLPDPLELPEALDGISDERKKKIMKCRHVNDRMRSLGAGLLLREVLPRFGVSPADIRIRQGGKPEAGGIFFNLSHSGALAICAVGEREVGCDVEKIAKTPERIAERFFHPNERACLKACNETERKELFYRFWTMKESYIKMTGEGMRLPLDSFEILLEGKQVRVRRDGKLLSCHITEYDIPGYKISVCAEEEEFAGEMEYTAVDLKRVVN